MKSDKRKQKWKQLVRKYSKNSRMRRRDVELRRNILKTLETSYISRNSRSKLEQKKEKKLRREKESSKNC